MKHYYDTVQNQVGAVVSGATVTVNVSGGGLATIYSDDGVTPKTNPTTTDAGGRFDFYVADGRYDIVVSGSGFTTLTQSNVEIFDATEKQASDTGATIAFLDGAPATPSITFAGDTDTGLYHSGANQVTVAVAGTVGPTVRTSGIGFGDDTQRLIFGAAGDASISRQGPAALQVGTGASGSSNGNLITNVFAASSDSGVTQNARLQPSGVEVGSGKTVTWSSTTNATGSADTGLSRAGAATVAVGDGTAGNTGGILVANDVRGGILSSINAGGLVRLGVSSDAGISRNAASVVYVGNGTAGNRSGTLGLTDLQIAGATSGATDVIATATASGTLTLPAATDTLIGKATTDTLTNKTLDTAGAGNVLRINGTQVSAVTGTGSVVLATAPTLSGGLAAADPAAALGLVTKQYVDTFRSNRVSSVLGSNSASITSSASYVSTGFGVGPITPARFTELFISTKAAATQDTATSYVILRVYRSTVGIPAINVALGGSDVLVSGSEMFFYSVAIGTGQTQSAMLVDTGLTLSTGYYYYLAMEVQAGTSVVLQAAGRTMLFVAEF